MSRSKLCARRGLAALLAACKLWAICPRNGAPPPSAAARIWGRAASLARLFFVIDDIAPLRRKAFSFKLSVPQRDRVLFQSPSACWFVAALKFRGDLFQGFVTLDVSDAADETGRPILACGCLVADAEFARERSTRLQYFAIRKFNGWPFQLGEPVRQRQRCCSGDVGHSGFALDQIQTRARKALPVIGQCASDRACKQSLFRWFVCGNSAR